MDNQPENKSIQLDTDYENHAINMKFSNNLTDDRERGYILSAAFFSYCASQGLDKQEVIEMVNSIMTNLLELVILLCLKDYKLKNNSHLTLEFVI